MTAFYDLAEDGNVALTGEVDVAACGGTFVLALGFGPDAHEAAHRARASLLDDFDAMLAEYVDGWLAGLRPVPRPSGGEAAGARDLFLTSAAVIRVHETEAVPGAIIASLSTPWGEARGDETPEGTGGYHLVWPRDLALSAGGLVAAGASREALRTLDYLRATQDDDGHWPQNMWVNSARYWDGIQLGETALPVLLADQLARAGALGPRQRERLWPAVRKAAGYIVRSGPSTQQDRWENQRGYTPFTIAAIVAALAAAAEMADACGEGPSPRSSARPPTAGTAASRAGCTSPTPRWRTGSGSRATTSGRSPPSWTGSPPPRTAGSS
jgi:glucoamylase